MPFRTSPYAPFPIHGTTFIRSRPSLCFKTIALFCGFVLGTLLGAATYGLDLVLDFSETRFASRPYLDGLLTGAGVRSVVRAFEFPSRATATNIIGAANIL
jgi:hypothetical protein